jgi:hypothetical protein
MVATGHAGTRKAARQEEGGGRMKGNETISVGIKQGEGQDNISILSYKNGAPYTEIAIDPITARNLAKRIKMLADSLLTPEEPA